MSAAKPARRAFLAGLAAVAAPAVVTPVAATTAAPSIQEVLEILEIGQRLPALVEAVFAAEARKVEARAVYERTKPPIPKQLIVPEHWHERDISEDERDIENAMLPHNGRFPARRIYVWREMKARMIVHNLSPDSDEGKKLRKLIRIARKHERASAAALAASGYPDRKEELERANDTLDEQIDRLLELEPVTKAGLVVYARAISACRDTSGLDKADQLGEVLADALLRMDTGAQAAAT